VTADSAGDGPGWRLALSLPAFAVAALEDALALDDAAISSFKVPDSGDWRIEVYYPLEPDRADMTARVAAAAQALEMTAPQLDLSPLPQVDWLAENRKTFAPLTVGRFFLHGRHDRAQVRPGHLSLEIEAGRAFGTGRHETTRGCLMALQLLSRRCRPSNALDLGCGSGVLAMAMAHLWRRPVLASDIDPWAVRTTRRNAELNAVAPLLKAVEADGVNHRALRTRAPYDLIVANILARPLLAMAGPIVAGLAPGGHLILSGLLGHQRRQIVATYRGQGLVLQNEIRLGDWPTLLLVRK
jgi:ribosomal protein L11 methyltransferase